MSTSPPPPAATAVASTNSNSLVICQGWLLKWTNYVKGYQKRWFIINGGHLEYYLKPKIVRSSSASVRINLKRAFLRRFKDIGFIISDRGTVLYIKAMNNDDFKKWVSAINKVKKMAPNSTDIECIKEKYERNIALLQEEMKQFMNTNDLIDSDSNELLKSFDTLKTKLGSSLSDKDSRYFFETICNFWKHVNKTQSLGKSLMNDILEAKELMEHIIKYEINERMNLEKTLEAIANDAYRSDETNTTGKSVTSTIQLYSSQLKSNIASMIPDSGSRYMNSVFFSKVDNVNNSEQVFANEENSIHQSEDKLFNQSNTVIYKQDMDSMKQNIIDQEAEAHDRNDGNSGQNHSNQVIDRENGLNLMENDEDVFNDVLNPQCAIQSFPDDVANNQSEEEEDLIDLECKKNKQYDNKQNIPQPEYTKIETKDGEFQSQNKMQDLDTKISKINIDTSHKDTNKGSQDKFATQSKSSLQTGKKSASPPSSQKRTIAAQIKVPLRKIIFSVIRSTNLTDLSRIAMPVSICEPLSNIQRLTEGLSNSYLLDRAATSDIPGLELVFLAAFIASSYSSTEYRSNKPFNPLLHETYELDKSNDLGWKLISEQVSHHPPISAMHVESADWRFTDNVCVETEFRTTHLRILPKGKSIFEIKTKNQLISFGKVTLYINNLLSPWVEIAGTTRIMNHSTKYYCDLTFINSPKFSRYKREIQGQVYDPKGHMIFKIGGQFNQEIDFVACGNNNATKFYKPTVVWRENSICNEEMRK
ncbi:MAG: hypothetical protein MHMPM18_001157 [Marteilia pararefringens]